MSNTFNSFNQEKWDKRFLGMAQLVSIWSKDPSTKVGAVITDGSKKIVSLGYNGLPQHVIDLEAIYANREEKYKYIIHAEVNAILQANKDVTGGTIYTYPFLTCPQCASMIIQAGIMRVVSYKCVDERWTPRIEDSKKLLQMANVEIMEYPALK
jgi:dCMP deaminase